MDGEMDGWMDCVFQHESTLEIKKRETDASTMYINNFCRQEKRCVLLSLGTKLSTERETKKKEKRTEKAAEVLQVVNLRFFVTSGHGGGFFF